MTSDLYAGPRNPACKCVGDTRIEPADYDLRIPAEVAATADVVPAGASYTLINLMASSTVGTPDLSSAATAEAYMQSIERQFVTSASSRQALANQLNGLANTNGAQLYHCTAGKDRTGWVTAVLLTMLGVPADTVMQDYLLSNQYYYSSPAVQAQLAALPAAMQAGMPRY